MSRRVHYVSTCYVSGRWQGLFDETDLARHPQQSFNNFYEETKFLAEVEVQRRMRDDKLPVTIYRPAVVVGDRCVQTISCCMASRSTVSSGVRASVSPRCQPMVIAVELLTRLPAQTASRLHHLHSDCRRHTFAHTSVRLQPVPDGGTGEASSTC
jgi:thioester reductase-like protein